MTKQFARIRLAELQANLPYHLLNSSPERIAKERANIARCVAVLFPKALERSDLS